MIRDLLEGFKYVNHLWPIMILRFYVGYFFFSESLLKQSEEYSLSPKLSALIDQNLFSHYPPDSISSFYTSFVQSNWQIFANLQINFEWVAGLLFFIGFLNRPLAFLSIIYLFFTSYINPVEMQPFYLQLQFILLTLLVFALVEWAA